MSQSKRTRTFVVTNDEGVHARAASLIAKLARKFQATVELTKGHERVEATEVLQVLSLGAGPGEHLTAEASGIDAEEALDALAQLFEYQFSDEITKHFGLHAGQPQTTDADDSPAA